ncbi:MAG TPA: glycosyl hydrolase family 18 protein [Puia sp.]|nr:glycosyl hydrolase family 18 protein [Puia sp.]
MYKVFPLPILLALTCNVLAAGYNGTIYPQTDTIPGITAPKVTAPQVTAPKVTPPKVTPPKEGLLKKLAQFLKFRQNARTREQTRVLAIIDSSGLKDSLQAAMTQLDKIDSAQWTLAQQAEHNDISSVLAAIDSLKTHAGNSPDVTPDTGPGVDDQAIQDLVAKMLNAPNPADQQALDGIRRLLDSGNYKCDTLKINDTLSERHVYRVRNRLEVIGLYPFNTKQPASLPDLRLIDEVAWVSVGFKGGIGKLTGDLDWQKAAILDSAARQCRLSLCVQSQDRRNIDSLLRSPAAQVALIGEILNNLDERHAAGVNILFDDMPPDSANLTAFIKRLAAGLKGRGRRSYTLGIRIPAYATEEYDLPALDEYVDRFWVDFTKYRRNDPSPLAPLAGVGNNDLKTCISRYLNMSIPPSKLMVCLPYFGIRWTWRSGKWISAQPITYSEIRERASQSLPVFDPLSATERLDSASKTGTFLQRIWYDDAVSLEAKFEFIRQNNLGGVVIASLGDDDGYTDLWDVRTAILSAIDTTTTVLRIEHKKQPPLEDWQWSWTYINAKFEQYDFILTYPCETEFPKVLIRKWEKAGVRNNDRSLIRKEESTVLGVFSIVIAILFLTGLILSINRLRNVGETWRWTKPLAAILIFLFILLTISTFTFLFLDTSIVFFGASDESSGCFDFPLGTLFTVVFIGVAIGFLITRFGVFRLIRRDDVP